MEDSMLILALTLLACDGNQTEETRDTGETGTPTTAVCDEPVEPDCVDDLILDFSLHDDKESDGEVTTAASGTGWVTTVDASAGGMNQASNNPWVYVRFAEDGAHRVDIDDETALESLEWHVAARRYIIRTNSGDSGGSCVGTKSFPSTSYEDLGAPGGDVSWEFEDFYSDACVIQEDNSGLPGSPVVVLGDWWSYSGCVETTGVPFLLRLEDGRVIKLTVDSYYKSGQEDCNNNGSGGSGSAEYTWRWEQVAP